MTSYPAMMGQTMQTGDIDEARWHSVLAKDRAQDGRFVFAVATTGVYCRPSCPARPARRENVRFFAACADAEAAGFRSCRRCRPDEEARDMMAVRRALAILRDSEAPVPLDRLAAEAGYSPAHFQRLFKAATGLSPAAYARALRHERAALALSGAARVTDAIYDAGYGAPSRFYAACGERLGMTASAWANGGRGVTIRWAVAATDLGPLLVAATSKGICRVAFGEDAKALARRFPLAELAEGGADLAGLVERVVSAVNVPGRGADIPLDVRGTAFQEAVWQELRRIPSGETRTYAQIAAAIGNPGAVRACGSANGANPVAVLIPCHRVVRTDGSLGGYAWGEDVKAELLRRERG